MILMIIGSIWLHFFLSYFWKLSFPSKLAILTKFLNVLVWSCVWYSLILKIFKSYVVMNFFLSIIFFFIFLDKATKYLLIQMITVYFSWFIWLFLFNIFTFVFIISSLPYCFGLFCCSSKFSLSRIINLVFKLSSLAI